MESIHGTFAPIPTPFAADGSVDLPAVARLLERLAAGGLDGILVLGSNGEFPSLTLDERRSVAAEAAGVRNGLRLILNVGSCSVPEAVELTRLGATLGYDAILCPPPFYLKAPVEGVAAFLRTVLDAASLPVLLYNIPQRTGVPLDDRLLGEIGDHQMLAGVKDSSGDPGELLRLAGQFSSGSYLVGNDRLMASSREAGGTGSITAAANVVPELVRAVWDDDGLQPVLNRLRGVLERYGLIPAAKAVLRRAGLGKFRVRPPLVDLAAPDADRLAAELARVAPGWVLGG